jgi:hypothetical protein
MFLKTKMIKTTLCKFIYIDEFVKFHGDKVVHLMDKYYFMYKN